VTPRLVLASSSPRRLDLLAALGLRPEVRPAHVDETPGAGESGAGLAARLARAKVDAVAGPGELVVGADTVVVVDGEQLGKPVDAADGDRMLRRLAGREHEVLTGLAVRFDGRTSTTVVGTRVRFRPLDDADIAWYRATGEGRDKAGGYGIQGAAAVFVVSIEGSYPNVVGLPLAELDEQCRAMGWPLRELVDAGEVGRLSRS
jgi:septum formation protein